MRADSARLTASQERLEPELPTLLLSPPLLPPPPLTRRAPLTVAGFKACGPARDAMYAFPCIGPCGCLCAQGTRAQPFRSLDRLGQRDEWQRTCLACYARLLARSRWDAVRQVYASYVARVLACGLLKAYFRACERMYRPGGSGYKRARDEFEVAQSQM